MMLFINVNKYLSSAKRLQLPSSALATPEQPQPEGCLVSTAAEMTVVRPKQFSTSEGKAPFLKYPLKGVSFTWVVACDDVYNYNHGNLLCNFIWKYLVVDIWLIFYFSWIICNVSSLKLIVSSISYHLAYLVFTVKLQITNNDNTLIITNNTELFLFFVLPRCVLSFSVQRPPIPVSVPSLWTLWALPPFYHQAL